MLILCQIYPVTSCADSFTELWNSSNVRYSIRNGSVGTPIHFYYSFSQFYYRMFSVFFTDVGLDISLLQLERSEKFIVEGKKISLVSKKKWVRTNITIPACVGKWRLGQVLLLINISMYNKYHPLIIFFYVFYNLLIHYMRVMHTNSTIISSI